MTFEDRVLSLLTSFSIDVRDTTPTEAEIIGRLSGHIVGTDPSIDVIPEAVLDDRGSADLLLKRNGEKIVVEVKRSRSTERLRTAMVAQVASYMHAAGADTGVVYVIGKGEHLRKEQREIGPGRKVWLLIAGDQEPPPG
jgi:hypothetical protein